MNSNSLDIKQSSLGKYSVSSKFRNLSSLFFFLSNLSSSFPRWHHVGSDLGSSDILCFLAGLQGDVSPSVYWVSGQVIQRHSMVWSFGRHHIGFILPLCEEAQAKQKGHEYVFQLTLAASRFSSWWPPLIAGPLSQWAFRCFQMSAFKSSGRGFSWLGAETSHPCCVPSEFSKNLFYWSIVGLQCCVNFHWTAEWFSYTYVYIPFHILFHYGLLQDIECSSLCCTVGSCCLSILYIIVCIC